jgi:hypothetical protein
MPLRAALAVSLLLLAPAAAAAQPHGVFGGCPAPHLVAGKPTGELTVRFRRDPDSRKWKILELRQGRRAVARHQASTGIDCVSGIFLSADRKVVTLEVQRSKMTLMPQDDPAAVITIRLRRPLPPLRRTSGPARR